MHKSRNAFLDITRGVLIVLVVVDHLFQYNVPNYVQDPLFNIIVSFYMPLFMIISGFIAYISLKDQSFLVRIKSKFLTLVVPFLASYYLIQYLIAGFYKVMDLKEYTLLLIHQPDAGLWFLWVLFLCYLVYYLALEFKKLKTGLSGDFLELLFFGIIILILFLSRQFELGTNLLRLHLPSFLIGILVAKHYETSKKIINKLKEVAFAIFPILLIPYNRDKDPHFITTFFGWLGENIWIAGTIYRYIVYYAGSLFFVLLIKKLDNKFIKDKLEYLGKHTIDIYVLQLNLVILLPIKGILTNTPILNYGIIGLTAFVFVIICLFIANYIIRQSDLGSRIFLGRSLRKIN